MVVKLGEGCLLQDLLERASDLMRAAWTYLVTGTPEIYQEVNDTLAEHPLLQFAADALPILLSLVLLAFGAFRWIVTQTRVATIRKATGDKIVILVARFHGDKKDRLQRLLIAALCENLIEHDATAVQSFRLPRRFSTELSGPKHERAKKKARRWLERTNGDVLIWGDDLSEGAGNSSHLFFFRTQQGTADLCHANPGCAGRQVGSHGSFSGGYRA